jgi:predicted nucleic acid-binding protein
MRAMLDTHVLSYGLSLEDPRPTDDKTRRRQRDSRALIETLGEVSVCSLVVFELLRAPPTVVARLKASKILDLLHVDAVDDAAAAEASRILEAGRQSVDTCSRCLNVKGATACAVCNQLVSHQQKTNDALILGTASVLRDVDTLYTYDPGVIELAKFVKGLAVGNPPNIDGPLFASTGGT